MQKQIIMLSVVVALCLSVLSCQAPSNEADIEAVRGVQNEYIRALNNDDVDAWVETMGDDAVYLPPNNPQLTGKEAIRSFMVTSFFEPFNVQCSISVQEVQILGDFAFTNGFFSLSLTPKDGGEVIEDKGKFIDIFKRQPDGSWKYYRVIFNSDMPLSEEEISTKG